jgi:hypothetical protein
VFVTEHNPNHKGNVAELAIAKEAASLGLSVFMPLTEHERYDLVLGVATSCSGSNASGRAVRKMWSASGFARRIIRQLRATFCLRMIVLRSTCSRHIAVRLTGVTFYRLI